jgi:hypothetical protein
LLDLHGVRIVSPVPRRRPTRSSRRRLHLERFVTVLLDVGVPTSVEVTLAVLEIVYGVSRRRARTPSRPSTVTVAESPGAASPTVHVTVPLVLLHDVPPEQLT